MSDKPTLPKLLETLDAIDKQLIDMPQEELDIVVHQNLPAKVDGLFHFLQTCDDRAKSLRERAKDMLASAKSLEGKRDYMENYIASKMAEYGFEKLPGKDYEIALRTSEAVEVDDVEITPEFLHLFEPYIRIKTEISKELLKPALRANEKDIPFARLKKNHHLKFSIKRSK